MKRYESSFGVRLIRRVAIYERLHDAIVRFFGRLMFVPKNACLLDIAHKLYILTRFWNLITGYITNSIQSKLLALSLILDCELFK